jgi:DNA-binding CsgD family transcriptional regulator
MARRERKAVPDTARIASAYRLTPAETRVLEAILAGQRPAEIAASASVSTETVRSQLKAIFSKTGTNGQTALVRLATGLGNMDS